MNCNNHLSNNLNYNSSITITNSVNKGLQVVDCPKQHRVKFKKISKIFKNLESGEKAKCPKCKNVISNFIPYYLVQEHTSYLFKVINSRQITVVGEKTSQTNALLDKDINTYPLEKVNGFSEGEVVKKERLYEANFINNQSIESQNTIKQFCVGLRRAVDYDWSGVGYVDFHSQIFIECSNRLAMMLLKTYLREIYESTLKDKKNNKYQKEAKINEFDENGLLFDFYGDFAPIRKIISIITSNNALDSIAQLRLREYFRILDNPELLT